MDSVILYFPEEPYGDAVPVSDAEATRFTGGDPASPCSFFIAGGYGSHGLKSFDGGGTLAKSSTIPSRNIVEESITPAGVSRRGDRVVLQSWGLEWSSQGVASLRFRDVAAILGASAAGFADGLPACRCFPAFGRFFIVMRVFCFITLA